MWEAWQRQRRHQAGVGIGHGTPLLNIGRTEDDVVQHELREQLAAERLTRSEHAQERAPDRQTGLQIANQASALHQASAVAAAEFHKTINRSAAQAGRSAPGSSATDPSGHGVKRLKYPFIQLPPLPHDVCLQSHPGP